MVSNIRHLVADDGCVVIAICNPFFTSVPATELHVKDPSRDELGYDHIFVYEKKIRESGRLRTDIHRPYGWYEHFFHQCGLQVVHNIETSNIDVSRLLPSSEFLVVELKPVPIPKREKVSLLIKASPIEWKTIDFQIRHIVSQLEGPQEFHEKIVITDAHKGPFLRAYEKPDYEKFRDALNTLLSDGVVDRVVFAPYDTERIRSTYRKWFGLESEESHSGNGQHLFTTLYGFDECVGDYILQVDSDCMIYRPKRSHDYLGEMTDVLKENPEGLTVSFNIAQPVDRQYTSSSENEKWRTEVRFCLLDRERLMNSLPLPNSLTTEGFLADPWHRALDNLLRSSNLESFRGGSAQTFYVHVPNGRKSDSNEWYNILKSIERGSVPDIQQGHVDLRGTMADWIGQRSEEMVLLVRGRNTYLPLLKRCVDSVKLQTKRDLGVVMIDACSQNGAGEYVERILLPDLGGRVSYLRNHQPLPAIQNISIATKVICDNPDSVIVHLDADDALIGNDVLTILANAYSNGADVTVGSMLRLDKQREYPVDFSNPRGNRGGNVWQHLRSFRKYLFDSIREEDLKIDGRWIPIAEDWAFMLPIVEMATSPVHITDSIYLYEPGVTKTDRMRALREQVIENIARKSRYNPSDVTRS